MNIDIAPTILSIANVAAPQIMHGEDLTKLMDNPEMDWRDTFFYEHLWPSSNRYYIPSTEGVVWNDKKYMKYFMNENRDNIIFEELYDLSEDPNEIHNLINIPEHQELQRRLQEEYTRIKKMVN